ncbi:Thymidylate kinase [hydrothermal vent metagenome]|uniref:dTMP kinase n=1 Tax=hydrothermal vent metagenome TaxID=652676 RepID=A0A1W1CPI2_9ZZZZ
MFNSKFITIDGVEGTGKSTQIALLTDYLKRKEIDFILTREPGGTILGEEIREVLLNTQAKVDKETELLLMFAARNQHIQEKIKPALAQGKWVISDRWTDATFAYQGGGRKVDEKRIIVLEKFVQGDFQADLSLFLDLEVKTSMDRVAKRGEKDRIEQEDLDFFERVRDVYLERAKKYPQRIKVIDASQSIDEIHQQIIKNLSL